MIKARRNQERSWEKIWFQKRIYHSTHQTSSHFLPLLLLVFSFLHLFSECPPGHCRDISISTYNCQPNCFLLLTESPWFLKSNLGRYTVSPTGPNEKKKESCYVYLLRSVVGVCARHCPAHRFRDHNGTFERRESHDNWVTSGQITEWQSLEGGHLPGERRCCDEWWWPLEWCDIRLSTISTWRHFICRCRYYRCR